MKLYRFEKITEERLQTLENGGLWFSSPKMFNDLSDCRLNMIVEPDRRILSNDFLNSINLDDFDTPLDNDIAKILLDIIKNNTNENMKLFINGDINGKIFRNEHNQIKVRDHITETTGVCCFFSSAPLNSLMWAHYGDNHKGFCIEYEVDTDNIACREMLFEVNYVSSLPEISPEELLFSPHSTITRVLASKPTEWSYEMEYRLVLYNGLSGSEKGKGKFVDLPNWIKPTNIICGVRQKLDNGNYKNDINYQMETLSTRLKASRSRVFEKNGTLDLQNISKR